MNIPEANFNHQDTHPSVAISELEFSDGNQLTFSARDIVLIVGPNNAGKSATLRAIRDKLAQPAASSPVLRSVRINKTGTVAEFANWLEMWARRLPDNPQDPVYSAVGHNVHKSQVMACWQRTDHALAQISRWICHFLSADERLAICNPPNQVPLTKQGPVHPIHFLQRDDMLERHLSAKFRQAFGVDFIVHHNSGSHVPLHVGRRPKLAQDEDRVSISYLERLEELPQLQTQGDGMRSFAGVLLATSVGREMITLIDEPEAFLHPPQAKLLGSFLVEGRGENRQLFIATHSTDVLRGVLNSSSPDVKVIRIHRVGDVNRVRLLDNRRIEELWGDSLLRYSNILDGLFHEVTVVCESDADCRFYAAILDSLQSSATADLRRADVLFTNCGGKARLPLVVRALREVGVPVRAVADFDILSEEQPLRELAESFGLDWTELEADWKQVKSAVDSKSPELRTDDVKREIGQVLSSVHQSILPENVRSALRSIVRRTSPWSNAKVVGKSFIPPGIPSRACERLLEKARCAGLHIVEVGELEGFCRTVDGHGPKWVNAVLARDLATDSELGQARYFVQRLLAPEIPDLSAP